MYVRGEGGHCNVDGQQSSTTLLQKKKKKKRRMDFGEESAIPAIILIISFALAHTIFFLTFNIKKMRTHEVTTLKLTAKPVFL